MRFETDASFLRYASLSRWCLVGKGDITRERIVAAAAPLFNQKGFAGCSMQDIMAATGLEKGGLYRHFSSKEELAAEAFRFAHARSARTRTDDLDPSLSPLDRLRAAITRFVEYQSALPGGCPVMNTAIDADDSNAALRELALEAFTNWRRRLAAIVREGMRAGQICSEIEPRQVANTVVATLEGALMLSRLEGTRTPLRDAAISLNTLLNSLEVSPTAPRRARAKRTARTIGM